MTAKEVLAIIRKNYPYQEFGLFHTLEKALEELEAIKSADGGEALEALEMIREYYDEDGEDEATCDSWKIVENYILKAQAQEQELRELKEKVNHFLNYIDDWAESSSLDNFETYSIIKNGDILDDLLDELENLCKGSEVK